MTARPLLSICIPTFNRGGFLSVMLEALLPQVADIGPSVEVWVSDNGSADETRDIVEQARFLGPVKFHRNEENLGPLANIVLPATRLAAGEYVWLLGDHNLVLPHAVARVVTRLQGQPELDVFYVNFRCAAYPEQWPKRAPGGHDGNFQYLANEQTNDKIVPEWNELIRGGSSALCTQAYAHIIRARLWRDHWANREIGESYTSAETTYPHTYLLAQTRFNARAYYIGEPAITIFNGAQSWSDPQIRARVALRGLPQLLTVFEKRGLSPAQRRDARCFVRRVAHDATASLFHSNKQTSLASSLSLLGPSAAMHPALFIDVGKAFIETRHTKLTASFSGMFEAFTRLRQYLIHYSVPARLARRWRNQ
jgi:glycosyltransferase involved in cell wall biosynthesis